MSKFVMSKTSIIVYLESSPPFLLELIYSCVLSIILIVLIFTVRERTQLSSKTIQQKTITTIHNPQPSEDGLKISYSKLKKHVNSPVHFMHTSDDSSPQLSTTTSETPNTRWSQEFKDSTQDLTFLCPSNKIIRPSRSIKSRRLSLSKRARSYSPIKKMNPPTTNKSQNYQFPKRREMINEMSPAEYESYVQSMTSIWNKLFNKPTPASYTTVGSVIVNDEYSRTAKDWKTRQFHNILMHDYDDPLKTDSTLAVRGSDSEINFQIFTESEVKMLDQPFRGSTESMYSNMQGDLQNDYHNFNTNLLIHNRTVSTSSIHTESHDPKVITTTDDCRKKSQFDIIYEEK